MISSYFSLAMSWYEDNFVGLKTHPRNYDITHCILCEDFDLDFDQVRRVFDNAWLDHMLLFLLRFCFRYIMTTSAIKAFP